MEDINNFLKRFRKLTPPDEHIKKSTSEVLKSIFNTKIDPSKISFNDKTGTIFLEINNTTKTAILLKKTQIIGGVNKVLSKNLVKDIH